MIERKTYLKQLIQLKNEHLIKVVTGIRRCGKSTLMLQFQDWLKASGVKPESIVSFNFEERENAVFEDWKAVYDHISAFCLQLASDMCFWTRCRWFPLLKNSLTPCLSNPTSTFMLLVQTHICCQANWALFCRVGILPSTCTRSLFRNMSPPFQTCLILTDFSVNI